MALIDREAYNAYMRAWRAKNPGRANLHARNTYARYAKEYAEAKRIFRAENPEYIKDINQRSTRQAARRARARGAFVEKIDREVVFDRDHGTCWLCGNFVDSNNWHLDHVIPIAKGGTHSYNNVLVAHPKCNQAKNAKILEVEALWL